MRKYDASMLTDQLSFLLYAASRELIKMYYPYLSKLDLTYTQYRVLLVLWEYRRISAKELGEKLHLDSGTLTPLLKNLEKRGLVIRERFLEDERVLMVELTPEGEALWEAVSEIPGKIAGSLPLNADETAELSRLLYKVLHWADLPRES